MALLDDVTVPDSLLSCPYLDRVPQINVRENKLSQVISRCKSSSPRARFLSPRSSKVAPWTEFQSSTCPPSFVTLGENPDLSSSSSSPRGDICYQNTATLDAMLVKETLKSSSSFNKRESITHYRKSLLEMLSPRFARTQQKAAQESSSSVSHSLNIPSSQDGREALDSNPSTALSTAATRTSPSSGYLESRYSWDPSPKTSSVRPPISTHESQCPKRLSAQGYQRLGSPYSVLCDDSSATTTTGGCDSRSDRTLTTFIESDETSSAKHFSFRGREQRYINYEQLEERKKLVPVTAPDQYLSLPCDLIVKSDANSREWTGIDVINSENRFSINPCFIPSVENLENVELNSSLNQFSSTKHSSIICDASVDDTLGNRSPFGNSSGNVVTRNTEALAIRESRLATGLIYAKGYDVSECASKTEAIVTDERRVVDHEEQINRGLSYHCDLQQEARLISFNGRIGLSQGEPAELSVNPSSDKSLPSTTDDSVHLSNMQKALIKIRLRRHRKYIMQQLQGLPDVNTTNDVVRLPSQECLYCNLSPRVSPCCPCLCSSLAEPKHQEDLPLPIFDTVLGWVSPRESAKSPELHIASRQERICRKCTHQRQLGYLCNCQRRLKKKNYDHDVCRLCNNCLENRPVCCCSLEVSEGFLFSNHYCNNREFNLMTDAQCPCENTDVNLLDTNCHTHECQDFAIKEFKSGKVVSESNDADPSKISDQSNKIHSGENCDYCLICAKKSEKRFGVTSLCSRSDGNPASGAPHSNHRLRHHDNLRSKPHSRELMNKNRPLEYPDLYSKSKVREIHCHGRCLGRALGNFTARTKGQNFGHHVCAHRLCLEHTDRSYKELECNRNSRDKIYPINKEASNLRKCQRRKRISTRLRDSSEVWQRQFGDHGTLDLLNSVSDTLKTLLENTTVQKSRGGECVQLEGSNLEALSGTKVLNSHKVCGDAQDPKSVAEKYKQSNEQANSDNTNVCVSEVDSNKVNGNIPITENDLKTKLKEKDNTSVTDASEKVSNRPYNSCDSTPFISKDSRTSFISSADLWYKSLVPASKARYHAQISNTIRNLLILDPYTHDDFAFHWDPDEKKKMELIGQKPVQRSQKRDVIKLPCGSALDAGVHHQKFILYTI